MKNMAIATIITLLMGCVQLTSAERNTRHFVYSLGSTTPTIQRDINSTYKLNLPLFQKAYAGGQRFRSSGGTLAQATDQANAIRLSASKNLVVTHTYTPNVSDKWKTIASDKDAKAFGDGLAQTFLDGYNGA